LGPALPFAFDDPLIRIPRSDETAILDLGGALFRGKHAPAHGVTTPHATAQNRREDLSSVSPTGSAPSSSPYRSLLSHSARLHGGSDIRNRLHAAQGYWSKMVTSKEPGANEPVHRFIETNGIRMHVVEQGRGPTVLLCHGFPESWYSWRHQLGSLAAAGFNVVAPDMRGYGQTDRPESIDQYSLLHLIGDLVGLLDALGKETAVIVGHDWGAPVAWYSALLRPDRFRGVAGLSVPFMPRGAVYPSKTFPETADAIFYQSYFQVPGVAETELEEDVHRTISGFLYNASGDAPRHTAKPSAEPAYMVPRNGGMLRSRVAPSSLPSWITEKDIDVYGLIFYRELINASKNAVDRSNHTVPNGTDPLDLVPGNKLPGYDRSVPTERRVG
jgi:pimeloyl-ACP methyl ester carboxylesterase